MPNQLGTSVLASDGETNDELLVQYGQIAGDIVANFISQKWKNINYVDTPIRGGTIKVKRMKSATSQPYGTARTAREGNALQNNGVDVKIEQFGHPKRLDETVAGAVDRAKQAQKGNEYGFG